VCGCLHNSQSCVDVSLLVNVHCPRCSASRVVFLMRPLRMYCRLLLCSLCGMQDLLWGGGFCVTSLKVRGERGFYGWSGFSKASNILLGNRVCSSFRWLSLVNSA